MQRFITFVDGSNLDGVLKHLNLRVDDYGAFYRHIFEQSVMYWGRTFAEGCAPWAAAQHSRIYWYVVGKMDEWDLNDPKAEHRLRGRFEMNPRLRDGYLDDANRRTPGLSAEKLMEEAWHLCFNETRDWYENKRRALEKKKRFYHGVQAATDFVEIRQEGHWKVDLLQRVLNEKGLDTSLAVDMVALRDTFDVALLISGDADGIPGINYVKGHSKHVGVVEFRRGSSAEFPTNKGASSRLKIAADFVVQIYEADLIRRDLAYRSESDFGPPQGYLPHGEAAY